MWWLLPLLLWGYCLGAIVKTDVSKHVMGSGLVHELETRRVNHFYRHRHHSTKDAREKQRKKHRDYRRQREESEEFNLCEIGGAKYCLREYRDSAMTCGYYDTSCSAFYHRFPFRMTYFSTCAVEYTQNAWMKHLFARANVCQEL